uniref:T. congolense-specific, cell surface-expressed gene family n=1 Tax=Trypanosoma congolense (strain IL3000) TaxID=1068625 RepID=F9W9S9_TRYCI|nr:hypothetical protein, unlikely [Trypanosoma congolense IL3000]
MPSVFFLGTLLLFIATESLYRKLSNVLGMRHSLLSDGLKIACTLPSSTLRPGCLVRHTEADPDPACFTKQKTGRGKDSPQKIVKCYNVQPSLNQVRTKITLPLKSERYFYVGRWGVGNNSSSASEKV